MLINKTIHNNTGVKLSGEVHGVAKAMAVALLFCQVNFAFADDAVTSAISTSAISTSDRSASSAAPATTQVSSHWTLGSAVGEGKGDLTQVEAGDDLSTSGVIASQFNVEEARVGWKFNVGFDLTRNFAIKAGYMDLNEATSDTSSAITDPAIFGYQTSKSLTTSAEGFSLGSVYRYNVTDSLGFTGSVGVFNWESNFEGMSLDAGAQGLGDQTGGTDIYFGLGGGYKLTEEVSLSIEWEHYKLNDEDTDMLSIGVNYHFK